MTKKTENKMAYLTKKTVLLCLVILILVAVFCLSVSTFRRYRDDARMAEIVSVRQLVINSTTGTKLNAPIDAKTGDVYFPQARLYLPVPEGLAKLTYAYDTYANKGQELSISNQVALSRSETRMYAARDMLDFFSFVPELQSCQRGIIVSYTKMSTKEAKDNGQQLKETVSLNNGKLMYLYSESACPELNDTVQLLKNLRSY